MGIDIRNVGGTTQSGPVSKAGKAVEPQKLKPKELHVGDKIEAKVAHETAATVSVAPVELSPADRAEATRLFEALDQIVGTKKPEGKLAEFLELATPALQSVFATIEPKEAAAAVMRSFEPEHKEPHGELLRDALFGDDKKMKAALETLPPKTRAVFEQLAPATLESIARAMRAPLGKSAAKQDAASVKNNPTASAAEPDAEVPAESEIHKLFAPNADAIAGMDVETMVEIVMMQASKDAEVDLKEMLDQMKVTNDKKQLLRTQLSEAKEAKAAIEHEIRAEYDARTKLSPDNSLYIDPKKVTYEAYAAVREVMGTVPALDLTKDLPLFPRDTEVKIDPQYLSQEAGVNEGTYEAGAGAAGAPTGEAGAGAQAANGDKLAGKAEQAEKKIKIKGDIDPDRARLMKDAVEAAQAGDASTQRYTGDRALDAMLATAAASNPIDAKALIAEITKRYPRQADAAAYATWLCQRMGAHKPPLAGDKVSALKSALATGIENEFKARTTAADANNSALTVGSSRVDLQACKLEYSIVSPK